jgi:hypothetical protein
MTTNGTVDTAVAGSYAIRYTATDDHGHFATATRTVTVLPFPPAVATLPAGGVNATFATLNGTVDPGGGPTKVWFEYGVTRDLSLRGIVSNPGFESDNWSVPPGYAGGNGGVIDGWTFSDPTRVGLNPAGGSPFADNGAVPEGDRVAFIQSAGSRNTLATTLANLTVGGVYTVRFRANCRGGYPAPNPTWSVNGGPFVPFAASPAVGGNNAYYTNSGTFTATDTTAALVLANDTPSDTTVLLDAFAIDGSSDAAGVGAGSGREPVSIRLGGLQPNTRYYCRITASNASGEATGQIVDFVTAAVDRAVDFRTVGGFVATGGGLRLGFTNVTGLQFTVLSTANLSAPVANWTAVGTMSESPAGSGLYGFTNAPVPGRASRYYRVRSP